MSPSNSKKLVYLDPLIITPQALHRTTLVILHGRGSTAEKFANPLLEHPVAALGTEPPKPFRFYFPHTKFVFPTAPLRRAVAFKRSLTHQWFDNWSLSQPELKQHLQIPGLQETSEYLHKLLKDEINIVGEANVVLMGLSQGCAASLICTMLWNGDAFGAVVGMCGYLPLRKSMAEFTEGGTNEEDNPFAGSDLEEDMLIREASGPRIGESKLERAIAWLRAELQANDGHSPSRVASGIKDIPVFMGHGSEDEKVPNEINKLAAEFLSSIGVTVERKEYQELGHWYSDSMLRDIVEFLKRLKGWNDMAVDKAG